MNAPSSLDSTMLARRLVELAGDERQVQVDFLLHLAEFDRRRAYVEAGYASLWDYALQALHLREAAAGRRIGAMRVLRRFPKLEKALRDGRLCLTTIALLGQVLTDENVDQLVAAAAYQTTREVEHLVVSIRPRRAPREGIRKLPDLPEPETALAAAPPAQFMPGLDSASHDPAASQAEHPPSHATAPSASVRLEPESGAAALVAGAAPVSARSLQGSPALAARDVEVRCPTRAEVRPVSEASWSLRVTLDAACKKDLDDLTMLLGHKVPHGDLAAVLHEAIRCGLEKHGKRRGSVAPARKSVHKAEAARRSPARDGSQTIPAEVRRQVWARDGGRCTWKGPDGRRCESRWKLEFDHIVPPSLGGRSTVKNVRLLCRSHNFLHAEKTYGRAFMDRFRRYAGTIGADGAGEPP